MAEKNASKSSSTISSMLSDVLSWRVLIELHSSVLKIMVAKIFRQLAFGFMYVLVIYLQVRLPLPSPTCNSSSLKILFHKAMGLTADKVGLLFFATLLGDAVVSITFTSFADKVGRKRCLLLASVLSIMAGLIVATQSSFPVLLFGMTLGIISVSGSDCGPFLAIELSCISEVSDEEHRTKIMAWYNLFSCFATAGGSLFCGRILSFFEQHTQRSLESSCRVVMGLYVLLHFAMFAVFMTLGSDIERREVGASKTGLESAKDAPGAAAAASPAATVPRTQPKDEADEAAAYGFSVFGLRKSKWVVLQLSLLFMLDAFAGGFVLHSVISNWFHTRYGTSPATLGTVFFVCSLVAGVTSLFSARIADFIGLILTMVFTHLPSQVFLMMIPLMPNQELAIALLCLRATVGGMDVPARNSFVQGAVDPDERSAAAGATNVIRSVGSASAPYLAGLLYADPRHTSWPFFIAGVLKITYDLSLMAMFSGQEEKGRTFWTARGQQDKAAHVNGHENGHSSSSERAKGYADPKSTTEESTPLVDRTAGRSAGGKR